MLQFLLAAPLLLACTPAPEPEEEDVPNPSRATASGYCVLREKSGILPYKVYLAKRDGKKLRKLLRLPYRPRDHSVEDRVFENGPLIVALVSGSNITRSPFLIRRQKKGYRIVSLGKADQSPGGDNVETKEDALLGIIWSLNSAGDRVRYLFRLTPSTLDLGEVPTDVSDVSLNGDKDHLCLKREFQPDSSNTYVACFKYPFVLQNGRWVLVPTEQYPIR